MNGEPSFEALLARVPRLFPGEGTHRRRSEGTDGRASGEQWATFTTYPMKAPGQGRRGEPCGVVVGRGVVNAIRQVAALAGAFRCS